jgi:hypothetical protein
MQTIPITLAEPGMTLDQAVMHPNKPDGMPVFGAGKELTGPVIERLKKLGIQSITVSGHPLQLPGDETLEQALSKLDTRFGAVNNDPYMMKIHDLFAEQIRRKYQPD